MHILYRQVNGFPLIVSSGLHRGGDTAVAFSFSLFILPFILHFIFYFFNFGTVSIPLEAFSLLTSYRVHESPPENLASSWFECESH